MSIFSELQDSFARWRQRKAQHEQTSLQFLHTFATSFQKYVGAPDHYLDPFSQTKRAYVEVLIATKDHNDIYEFKRPDMPIDVLARDEGGFFVAGIGLILDQAIDSYPKGEFFFRIRFLIRGSDGEMTIGSDAKAHVFSVGDPSSLNSIFDHMLGAVRQILGMEPWDVSKKATIGFLPLNSR